MIVIKTGDVINPIFRTDCVPICFSANNSYVPQTAVMVKSVIENSSKAKNYDIIILSTDIDETNEEIITSFANGYENISVRIVDISSMLENVTFFTQSVYTPTTYSKEAYFRLFIPFAMPEYDTVLYFDGDMVAVSDVSELMNIDMSSYIAAATRDYCGIAACYDPGAGRFEYRKEINIKQLDNYFISSMVIVNIKKFNEKYSLDGIKSIISSREWRQHDQDIFNVLCQDNLLLIDAKWSFFEEYDYSMRWLPDYLKEELLESSKNPCVIHYAGEKKAWKDENSELNRYFWKYASMTPYFDEFYSKINSGSFAYKYGIIKNNLNKSIDFCDENGERLLISSPYRIGIINNLKLSVEHIKISGDNVLIDGFYECVDEFGKLKICAFLNYSPIDVDISDRQYGNTSSYKLIRSFSISVSIQKYRESKITFAFTYDGVKMFKPYYVSVDQFAPINEYGYSFYSHEDVILTKRNNTEIVFEPYSKKKILQLNYLICKHLRSHKSKYFKKMALVRWIYYLTKKRMGKKNIVLISDTRDVVDSTTVKFVKYIKENEGLTPYLVVTENCANFEELKKEVGCVVIAQSKIHKFLFLHSKSIVTSDYYMPFILPMYSRSNEIRDIVANKRIVYWHKRNEDLSYNNKAWYDVSKFIIFDEGVYQRQLSHDNGYSDDNLCLIKDKNLDDVYKIALDCIRGDVI